MPLIKLPVSFKEFVKSPLAGVLYLCITGMVGLYADAKIAASKEKKYLKEQNEKCEEENRKQDEKIDLLTYKLMRSDSVVNRLVSKFETLKELGRIQ